MELTPTLPTSVRLHLCGAFDAIRLPLDAALW